MGGQVLEDRHIHSHTYAQTAVPVSLEPLLSCPLAATLPLLMRKTDTCVKLSLSLGLITFVIEVLTMECQLPQAWTVVSRLSQRRDVRWGARGEFECVKSVWCPHGH